MVGELPGLEPDDGDALMPPRGPKPVPLAERFADKYIVAENGCWIWTAATTRSGHGKILESSSGDPNRRRLISAHVASYMVHVGPVPDGKEIDHLCREKLCVNPEHLEAVTHLENMRRSQGPGGAHWLRLRVAELERQVAALETRLARLQAERDSDGAILGAA